MVDGKDLATGHGRRAAGHIITQPFHWMLSGGITVELHASPVRADDDLAEGAVEMGLMQVDFNLRPLHEVVHAKERERAVRRDTRLTVGDNMVGNGPDLGAVRIARKQRGGILGMILFAATDPGRTKRNTPVLEFDRVIVMEGSRSDLSEVTAIGVYRVNMEVSLTLLDE